MIDLNDNSLIGSNNQGVNGGGSDLPNFTPGDLAINKNPRNGRPRFNTSLFSVPSLGSPGTSPRRFFYGPGMQNWDIAVLKVTRFTESKVLEMRWETFNTFNHAHWRNVGQRQYQQHIVRPGGQCDAGPCDARGS